MKYVLCQKVMGHRVRMDIDESLYLSIIQSIDNVLHAIKFEEEWDVLVGNIFHMEKDILEVALYDMIYDDLDWNDFNDVRVKFVRHLANVLSSAESYLDHSPQSLNKIDLSGNLSQEFKLKTNEVYDGSFAYRFMEALRNHAQHNGHPVHSISFNAGRVEHRGGNFLRYVAGAAIDLIKLAENEKFKKAVIDEAMERGGKLDAVSTCREYISRLSDVHCHARKMIKNAGYVDRSFVDKAITIYEGNGGSALAMYAFCEGLDGSIVSERAILRDTFDRYDSLCRKNRSLQNFSRQYASGELLLPKR